MGLLQAIAQAAPTIMSGFGNRPVQTFNRVKEVQDYQQAQGQQQRLKAFGDDLFNFEGPITKDVVAGFAQKHDVDPISAMKLVSAVQGLNPQAEKRKYSRILPGGGVQTFETTPDDPIIQELGAMLGTISGAPTPKVMAGDNAYLMPDFQNQTMIPFSGGRPPQKNGISVQTGPSGTIMRIGGSVGGAPNNFSDGKSKTDFSGTSFGHGAIGENPVSPVSKSTARKLEHGIQADLSSLDQLGEILDSVYETNEDGSKRFKRELFEIGGRVKSAASNILDYVDDGIAPDEWDDLAEQRNDVVQKTASWGNNYIKEMSGSAVAAHEMKRNLKVIVSESQNPKRFENNLLALIEAGKRSLRLKQKILRMGVPLSQEDFEAMHANMWRNGQDDAWYDRVIELKEEGFSDEEIKQALTKEGYDF